MDIKEMFGNEIEERVEELMKEGKESPIRGWSAREISETISHEFIWKVDGVDMKEVIRIYAFNHIRELCGMNENEQGETK